MTKKRKKLDKRQMTLPFSRRVEAYLKEKEDIHTARPDKQIESYDEACIELAAAIKKAVRQSGMSRKTLRINARGCTPDGLVCRRITCTILFSRSTYYFLSWRERS